MPVIARWITLTLTASLLAICAAAYSANETLPVIVTDLAVTRDGQTVAVATEVEGGPYGVYLLSLEDGKIQSTIRGESRRDSWAYSVAFTPDSKTILIADGGIRRLSLPSLTPLPPPGDPEHPLELGGVRVAISADGRYLTGCQPYSFTVWDLQEAKVVYDNGPDNASNENGGNGLGCTVSPDGQLIVASDSFHHWECWQTKPSCISAPGGDDAFAFRPDGQVLATLAYTPSRAHDHTLIISTVDTHKVLRSLAAKVPAGSEGYLYPFYSPDGKLLALAGEGIGILEPEKGQIRKLFYSATFPTVNFLQFTPNGKRIVFAMKSAKNWNDYRIGLWDLAAQKLVWTVPLPALPKN